MYLLSCLPDIAQSLVKFGKPIVNVVLFTTSGERSARFKTIFSGEMDLL